jgi:putative membrane protein
MMFRMWIVGAALLVGSFFVATVPFGDEFSLVSAVAIVCFSVPALAALRAWLGDARALAAFVVLGLYAIAIEATSVVSGFPYSQFTYSSEIGALLGGLVPWTVPFAWVPILVGSIALVAMSKRLTRQPFIFALAVATVTVLVDLVLDPAATMLGFWVWSAPGPYYGVPLVNFAGWFLSGFIGSLMVWQLGVKPKAEPLQPALWGLVATLFFWALVTGWQGLWFPCVLGIVLTATILTKIVKTRGV